LPLTRWLCTIWRYSKPPDRLVRKYMPAPCLPPQFWHGLQWSQGEVTNPLALPKRSISGFATAECGFQHDFEPVTVKVR
jgi:hypothetical protein